MIKYFTEADDQGIQDAELNMNMDVQVGPEEEVSAKPTDDEGYENPSNGSEAEAAAKENHPVDTAKQFPETVPVAGICKESGEINFYVDAADVENYAYLTNKSMLEGINDIIAANEEAGMTAQNVVFVMTEGTEDYMESLMAHGAKCATLNEEDNTITVHVQDGPEGDTMDVKADPQEANPVDAVKRHYDSVVVATNDKNFFMDVEDVQKCAELNCESVIATLNNIINVNEESGISAENVVVLVSESTDEELISTLEAAGVEMLLK